MCPVLHAAITSLLSLYCSSGSVHWSSCWGRQLRGTSTALMASAGTITTLPCQGPKRGSFLSFPVSSRCRHAAPCYVAGRAALRPATFMAARQQAAPCRQAEQPAQHFRVSKCLAHGASVMSQCQCPTGAPLDRALPQQLFLLCTTACAFAACQQRCSLRDDMPQLVH